MTKIVQEAKNRPKTQKSSQKPKIEPKARNRRKIYPIAMNIPGSQILTQKPKIKPNDKNHPKSEKSPTIQKSDQRPEIDKESTQ